MTSATHATISLEAGIHPKVVQERLGHANIAVTMDRYSRVIPALQESAAELVAAIVDVHDGADRCLRSQGVRMASSEATTGADKLSQSAVSRAFPKSWRARLDSNQRPED